MSERRFEILLQPREPRRRAIDRGDVGAGGGKLRCLAARRRTKVGNAKSGNGAEKTRRQRGGSVLNPPRAFGKTWQRRDGAMRDDAHRAGRKQLPAELRRPKFGLAFCRQIERRLAPIGGSDAAGGCLTVSLDPARHQPLRGVDGDGVERHQMRSAFARDPTEHGVDQAGIAGPMAVRLHQTDGQIDGRMVGHVEEEDLRGADQERALDARRFLRQTAFEENADEMAQRAEPPQHHRDQRSRQRPIAVG